MARSVKSTTAGPSVSYPWLPFSSALDSSTRAAGSIDPLGLMANAERIAELMLPYVTNRMTRARLITISVIAVEVSERVRERVGGDETTLYHARMAFERLAASAIVRVANDAGRNRGLPGKRLVTAALSRNEPVTAQNYLSAPSINAPSGVFARLTRHTDLMKADDTGGAQAVNLITAWSVDEGLPGILDEGASEGAKWMQRAVKATEALLEDPVGSWPKNGVVLWRDIGKHLQLDTIGPRERRELRIALQSNAVRNRMLTHLKTVRALAVGDAPSMQRAVLWDGIRAKLRTDQSDDTTIGKAIIMAEGMERPAELLQAIFDDLMLALRNIGGSATPKYLLNKTLLGRQLNSHVLKLSDMSRLLATAIKTCDTISAESGTSVLAEELRILHDDVEDTLRGDEDALIAIMRRHERTQQAKQKGNWILRGDSKWTLTPGTDRKSRSGVVSGGYLHPFRIASMYSLMTDVGLISGRRHIEAIEE